MRLKRDPTRPLFSGASHGLHQVGGRASLGDDQRQRRQSLRGGALNQRGAIHIDIIIQNVLKTITAMWNRYSVGPPEILAIQVIFRNRETTLVHQAMMARSQQQQIVEAGKLNLLFKAP